MVTKIQKWGNSQGLRVPKGILHRAHISIGDAVDVNIHHGTIIIKPISQVRGKYRLKDLISKIPANYNPEEVYWGKPKGSEVW